MQPTTFGAQDRCFFEVVLCCAPTPAAERQSVGPPTRRPPNRPANRSIIPTSAALFCADLAQLLAPFGALRIEEVLCLYSRIAHPLPSYRRSRLISASCGAPTA